MNKLDYYKLEQVDMLHSGQTRSVIHIKNKGHIDGDRFIEEVVHRSHLHRGTIAAVFMAMVDELEEHLALGRSVEVPGLGTFSVGVRRVTPQDEDGKPLPAPAGDEPLSHHGIDLEFDRINFRKNKQFFRNIHERFKQMDFHRIYGKDGVRISKSKYRELGDRMLVARDFLQSHPFMTVSDYAVLTGLSHSTAQRELQKAWHDRSNGITIKGSGSHRVYVLAKPTQGPQGE